MTNGPTIHPVAPGDRPVWSVVIPAHQCADLVGRTVSSVLEQLGERHDAEIIVVDDGSTDHPEHAVAAVDPDGRVVVERNDRALGAVANFNRCLRATRGRYVHLLHGDDIVFPGFYERMERALDEPGIVTAVCRARYIDGHDRSGVVTRHEREGSGRWDGVLHTLAVSNRIRPAAIVARRDAYEQVGGFRTDLPHAADWEMWMRLAAHGPVYFVDEALAAYRIHGASDTATRVRTGINIRERREVLDDIVAYLPPSDRSAVRRKARGYSGLYAVRTAGRSLRTGDVRAVAAQLREAAICAWTAVRP